VLQERITLRAASSSNWYVVISKMVHRSRDWFSGEVDKRKERRKGLVDWYEFINSRCLFTLTVGLASRSGGREVLLFRKREFYLKGSDTGARFLGLMYLQLCHIWRLNLF
jgi:hypothetical protein